MKKVIVNTSLVIGVFVALAIIGMAAIGLIHDFHLG